MPGDSGVTVVTTLVCYLHIAREAAGAAGARHSLRPLIPEGRTFRVKLAWMRGEIAKLCLRIAGRLKIESVANLSTVKTPPMRRPRERGDP
jgi:hypothetical protein